MLNYNELKYIATKMAANPNVPVFTNFDGGKPIDPTPPPPSFTDNVKAFGKDYVGAMGYGAGIGALGGIPLALLANALLGGEENQSLRGYLKSALLGALLGGGLGAAGGAGLRHYLKGQPGVRDALGSALAKSELDAKGTNYIAPETMQYIERFSKGGVSGLLAPKPSAKAMRLVEQGSLSIPGVTNDYFGLPPERTDNLTSNFYGGLRDSFTQ